LPALGGVAQAVQRYDSGLEAAGDLANVGSSTKCAQDTPKPGDHRKRKAAMLGFYSKYDHVLRTFVPSIARASYSPFVKIVGDTLARILGWPFPELRDLPPNHLRIRVGTGNRMLNGHIVFLRAGDEMWLKFLSRQFCRSNSDIVELGCGCGRLARPLRDPPWAPWFAGTYVGVDIDSEMLDYCRSHFPKDRFHFIRSPHKSTIYALDKSHDSQEAYTRFAIADEQSKDFVYSLSLYSHLLEDEVVQYTQESFRILRTGGIMFITFFCIEHVERGGRWTFQYRRGNAYIESMRYPEAAVAYEEAFMIDIVRKCGFREVTVVPGKGLSELVAIKVEKDGNDPLPENCRSVQTGR
jgi:SAM-dependent methyltransferase